MKQPSNIKIIFYAVCTFAVFYAFTFLLFLLFESTQGVTA